MRRKKTTFEESLMNNELTYMQYVNRLMELSIAMWDWKNLPKSVDPRFLELTLFADGQAIFFKDEDLGEEGYLGLQVALNGGFDVYRIPLKRRAYAVNGYQKELNKNDSVIIYNNLIHSNCYPDVVTFAQRLYNLDRIVDVNANAQKTPILIKGSEQQRLTLKNLYKEYDGNSPVIYADKSLDMNVLQVLNTDAPYVADKIYELKTQIWNEALTYLGIPNVSLQKKERMISDEVNRLQGGTIASRYSRLEARKQACQQINEMFGLNIDCEFRDDVIKSSDLEESKEVESNSESEDSSDE